MIILLANSLVAAAVFVFALRQPPGRRGTLFLFAWFFFICPLAGPLFTLAGMLINRFYRAQEVDLSAISFIKDRQQTVLVPNSEMELNYAPLEDAMALADTKKVRSLLIDILKNNDLAAFTSVARAINSSDTEVSHYAAAAILDILSTFRARSRELLLEMRQYPDNVNHNLFVLEYFHRMLEMGVMNEMEYQATVDSINEIAENLFEHNLWYMKAGHYLWICDHLISAGDHATAQVWAERAKKYCPEELDTYKARLHVFYAVQDSAQFFACLQELKSTDITVDKEILDLFRLYA